MCQPENSNRIGWVELWRHPDGTYSAETYRPGTGFVEAEATFEHASDPTVVAEAAAIELGETIREREAA